MDMYVGLDLGGTTTQAAIAAADGRIVAERSVPTLSHEGPQRVLARMGQLVHDLAIAAGASPVACGVGVPGLLDLKAGKTMFLPNFPTNWRDVPIWDMLAAEAGCRVHLLNDVRTATLGEMMFGRGRHANTMAFFAIGTGIGGGVVVDGKLRLGPLGAAGELGHQIILPDGPRCGCGNRGCLEALASAPAIAAEGVRLLLSGQAPQLYEIVGGDPGRVSTQTMAQAARQGDARVAEAITRAAGYIGIGVVNVVVTLHPDLVVLGGGAAAIGDLLLDTVCATVRQRIGMFPTDGVRIETSELGDRAGVLGAIALAIHGGHDKSFERKV
ncbi:MAG TPA: ROK family protein [Candidatus Anammoximicrobium sp.]|nr:ROK family protein [Candidatus Anammoximicrobium sp.]